MALSRVVSEIFIVEKYRDIKIPVKGQSRSLKMVFIDAKKKRFFLRFHYFNKIAFLKFFCRVFVNKNVDNSNVPDGKICI